MRHQHDRNDRTTLQSTLEISGGKTPRLREQLAIRENLRRASIHLEDHGRLVRRLRRARNENGRNVRRRREQTYDIGLTQRRLIFNYRQLDARSG